jgi:hypothetical protein
LVVKSFSDEKLGGKEQSLLAAIHWRDAQIKINGIIDHRFVEAGSVAKSVVLSQIFK